MFKIQKSHYHGAVKFITTDRQMLKIKTFKTLGGAQRWCDGQYGLSHITSGWELVIVEY